MERLPVERVGNISKFTRATSRKSWVSRCKQQTMHRLSTFHYQEVVQRSKLCHQMMSRGQWLLREQSILKVFKSDNELDSSVCPCYWTKRMKINPMDFMLTLQFNIQLKNILISNRDNLSFRHHGWLHNPYVIFFHD